MIQAKLIKDETFLGAYFGVTLGTITRPTTRLQREDVRGILVRACVFCVDSFGDYKANKFQIEEESSQSNRLGKLCPLSRLAVTIAISGCYALILQETGALLSGGA